MARSASPCAAKPAWEHWEHSFEIRLGVLTLKDFENENLKLK